MDWESRHDGTGHRTEDGLTQARMGREKTEKHDGSSWYAVRCPASGPSARPGCQLDQRELSEFEAGGFLRDAKPSARVILDKELD